MVPTLMPQGTDSEHTPAMAGQGVMTAHENAEHDGTNSRPRRRFHEARTSRPPLPLPLLDGPSLRSFSTPPSFFVNAIRDLMIP